MALRVRRRYRLRDSPHRVQLRFSRECRRGCGGPFGAVPPLAIHPMRILFVTSMYPTPRFPLRGIVVDRTAEALRSTGQEVEILALGDGSPIRYATARRRVAAAVERFRPAVVHAHFGYSGAAVPNLSVPLVTTFYGDDLNGTWRSSGGLTWKSRIGIVVSQWVAWRSTRCVAVSRQLREKLWTPALRRKTTVIRDAVRFDLFRPLARDLARARLRLGKDEVLIMFPHDASQATKRVWLAEGAVCELQKRNPRARLWIVNGKPADEMPWYYAAADVMIVTSALEGGPSSVKEALACGVPVISVPVGDLEMFNETAGGMYAAHPTPLALADALGRALDQRDLTKKCLLPREFELSEAAERLMRLYREAGAS